MKNSQDLTKSLLALDGKGYPAYKGVKGEYDFGTYILSIDHVQGDPFASPSRARMIVSLPKSGFPKALFDSKDKVIAVTDFLTRTFEQNIQRYHRGSAGSGKSGLLMIDHCGQEVLERTSVAFKKNNIEARLEIGLPAAGRRILGREANRLVTEVLPKIVNQSLFFAVIDQQALQKQMELYLDQEVIRCQLDDKGWVAFVANGSMLPRLSGVSDKPMGNEGVPFQSPEMMEVELELPFQGTVKGMGIPEGITLIVGGGYHGKSTLLSALELGVYNHMNGDGRELVITRNDAVKIRSEDGRRVEKVNISPFISNLPNAKDTVEFSTENASGSTSQAANVMEALEAGTKLLLIDEDTSATNFMIRDERMKQLVAKEKEPITPFIDKVRSLYEDHQVSTILIVGGSGDYFDVADHVVMLDEYIPKQVTDEAKKIAEMAEYKRMKEEDETFGCIPSRIVLKSSFTTSPRGLKIKPKGLHTILVGKSAIDLSYLDQLMDDSQTNALAFMLEVLAKRVIDNKRPLMQLIDQLYAEVDQSGLDVLSPHSGHPGNMALPRKQELLAVLSRYRGLHVKNRE